MSDLRPHARAALGVSGYGSPSLVAEAVHAGAGWAPLGVLGGLAGVTLTQGAVLLLAPDIAGSLGRSPRSVGGVVTTAWALALVLAAPFALRLTRAGRRVDSAVIGGAAVGLALSGAALATSGRALGLAAVCGGFGTAFAAAAHRPLLADLYPPRARMRVLGAFRGVTLTVAATALVTTAPIAVAAGLSWRAPLLAVAAVAFLLTALAARLREPALGELDAAPVRALLGTDGRTVPRRLRFDEAVRRSYSLPTVRPILAAYGVLGVLAFALAVYGGYVLQQRHGVSASASVGIVAACALLGGVTAAGVAGRAEAEFRTAPRWLVADLAAMLGVAALAMLLTGLAPHWTAAAAGLAVAAGCLSVVAAGLDDVLVEVLPAELRPIGSLLSVGYAGFLGLLLGGGLLASIEAAVGLPRAFLVLGAVAAAAALAVRHAARTVDRDFDRKVDELLEREELSLARSAGTAEPLLSCRRIDFSYGPLQVLFGVDFTVDDGEMVALLGTNGAGKSTLLRVVSGLGRPSGGSVRYRGNDITFTDPTARVKLGMTQIPGGKAVFGPLSVAENLRLYGYALGRDRAAVERGIEESFATFPRLAERRNSPAATMSGGEQQMLALAKALILRPQLLLIDELSLGLAPKVVGELLEMVREINRRGTAVVLVEQSVNVALTLAERAYYMEKGAVRFEGPAQELLDRPEILRSVFLQGAAKGLGA